MVLERHSEDACTPTVTSTASTVSFDHPLHLHIASNVPSRGSVLDYTHPTDQLLQQTAHPAPNISYTPAEPEILTFRSEVYIRTFDALSITQHRPSDLPAVSRRGKVEALETRSDRFH